MRLKDQIAANEFMRVAMNCKGHVELRSQSGDVIDLKSMFSRYLAVDRLLNDHGNDLELFCSLKEDECEFMKLIGNSVLKI